MSRSGFSEIDEWDQETILAMGRTKGRITSATRGRRGQAFLRLALSALDRMEDKRLAGGTFGVGDAGCMCLMSSVATETGRASVLSDLDPWDGEGACFRLAEAFDVAPVLVQDLVWDNDENAPRDPAKRWEWMRARIASALQEQEPGGGA